MITDIRLTSSTTSLDPSPGSQRTVAEAALPREKPNRKGPLRVSLRSPISIGHLSNHHIGMKSLEMILYQSICLTPDLLHVCLYRQVKTSLGLTKDDGKPLIHGPHASPLASHS